MASAPFQDMSLDELRTQEKRMRMLVGLLIGFLVILIGAVIYLLYLSTHGGPKMSMPVIIIMLMISALTTINGGRLGAIQAEIKKRTTTP
ncbi:MAG: hypothetical protein SF053_05260 [Bacteroidia bacterium]|nr:hypothetical protein [Bacteroidia bacterium]